MPTPTEYFDKQVDEEKLTLYSLSNEKLIMLGLGLLLCDAPLVKKLALAEVLIARGKGGT
jgi:hypothetical protein